MLRKALNWLLVQVVPVLLGLGVITLLLAWVNPPLGIWFVKVLARLASWVLGVAVLLSPAAAAWWGWRRYRRARPPPPP